ncbi:hypothetical protein BH09PSE6_BH09PSE6_04830 [soil metagenome]
MNAGMQYGNDTLRFTDRSRINTARPWHVNTLAEKYGVSVEIVKDAVSRVGVMRVAVEAELARLSGAVKPSSRTPTIAAMPCASTPALQPQA